MDEDEVQAIIDELIEMIEEAAGCNGDFEAQQSVYEAIAYHCNVSLKAMEEM